MIFKKFPYVAIIAIVVAAFFCFSDFNDVFARGGGGSSSSSSSSGGGSRGGGGSSYSSGSSSRPSSSGGGSSSWGKSSGGGSSSWGSKSAAPSQSPSQPTTSSRGGKSSTPSPSPSSTPSAPSTDKSSWGSTSKSVPVETKTARAAAYASKNMVADKARVASVQNYAKNSTKENWAADRSNFSAGKSTYTPTVTPVQRSGQERTVIINKYYNTSPYGIAYADPFNHMMMWSFSMMWWANMWDSVDRAHYKDDARYKELEAEVAKLRTKEGFKADPNYRDPGMSDAVMYSDGYLQAVKDGKVSASLDALAKTSQSEDDTNEGLIWAIAGAIILAISVGLVFIYFRYRRRNQWS